MTLLEVVLAVAILCFLVGGMAGVVRMAISSSAQIEETEERTRAFTAFFRLCDQTFTALPAGATLLRTPPQGEDGFFASEGRSEITLRNAPAAFAIDDDDIFFGEVALGTRRQPDGDLVLGIEYRRIDRQTGQLLPAPRWIPLLRNLRGIEWSFFDARTGKWQAGWTDTTQRPTLVRLTLAPADGYPKETAVFLLPPLRNPAPQGTPPVPAATATSNPNPSGA